MSFTSQLAEGEERSKVDLNRLEPSFKYTTLFKRILLDMNMKPMKEKPSGGTHANASPIRCSIEPYAF